MKNEANWLKSVEAQPNLYRAFTRIKNPDDAREPELGVRLQALDLL
ncbi:MAG TPA: hypothetical protein VHE77_02220 [Dongiaceae bacterium]|jgi:hypothetical protein|nr:hypothetical protein [Dongiaceae bacterium]